MTNTDKLPFVLDLVKNHPAFEDVGDPERTQRLAVACEVYAHEYGLSYAVLRDAVAALPLPTPPAGNEEGA